jgi:hypothetical protein
MVMALAFESQKDERGDEEHGTEMLASPRPVCHEIDGFPEFIALPSGVATGALPSFLLRAKLGGRKSYLPVEKRT